MSLFVTIRDRGQISLPAAIRKQFRLDEPGIQLEVVVRDGEIVLKPMVPVAADQAWFWDEAWQAGEREADAEIAAANYVVHNSGEEFIASLTSSE
jgi:AbrB family looped-hinge helix DNA binding protein